MTVLPAIYQAKLEAPKEPRSAAVFRMQWPDGHEDVDDPNTALLLVTQAFTFGIKLYENAQFKKLVDESNGDLALGLQPRKNDKPNEIAFVILPRKLTTAPP